MKYNLSMFALTYSFTSFLSNHSSYVSVTILYRDRVECRT